MAVGAQAWCPGWGKAPIAVLDQLERLGVCRACRAVTPFSKRARLTMRHLACPLTRRTWKARRRRERELVGTHDA